MKYIQKKIYLFLGTLLTLALLFPTPVLGVEESAVPPSYFDDALFVGDSISLKLRNYVKKQGEQGNAPLGNGQFFTQGGFGSGIALKPVTGESFHPYWNGEKMYVEDAVALSGAKKVYIMLGMNDIVPYGPQGAVENLEALTEKILEKSPDVILAFQSVTPILTNRQQRNLNNASIALYNQELESFCNREGYTYLDVASVFTDTDGGLIYAYCGDAPGLGMHLSNEGCPPWIEYLLNHPITEEEQEQEQEAAEELEIDWEIEADEELEIEADEELEIEAEIEIEIEAEEDLSPAESESYDAYEDTEPADGSSDGIFKDFDAMVDVEASEPEEPEQPATQVEAPAPERPRMSISGTDSVTAQKPSPPRKKATLLAPRD